MKFKFLKSLQKTQNLYILSCVIIALTIAAFFLNRSVTLFIYDYMSGIASGTSFGKSMIFLFWILFIYLIAYFSARIKIKLNFKLLILLFLVSVALLSVVNLVAFKLILANTGYTRSPKEPVLITFKPEADVSYDISRLDHTHSLRPILYKILDPFVDVNFFKIDIGQALYQFFPSWLFYPTFAIFALYLVACLLLIICTAKAWKGLFALFVLLVFGIASCQFFIGALDCGLLGTTTLTGIATLSIYLLLFHLRKKSKIRWVLVLIFLPLIILGILDQLAYSITGASSTLAGTYLITFESHLIVSSLAIAAACFYAFKYQRRLTAILIFILAVNLILFKPYPFVPISREGDDVYMYLDGIFDSSTTNKEILKRLEIPELSNPEILARYKRVVYARAVATKAGISTVDLSNKVINERRTPVLAGFRFNFAESLPSPYTIFISINEDELDKISVEPIEINSFKKIDNLMEVNLTGPSGFFDRNLCQYFMLTLNQNGVKSNHCFFVRDLPEENVSERTKDFFLMTIPITSVRIKIYYPGYLPKI